MRDEPHSDVALDAHRKAERGVPAEAGTHGLHRADREDQEHPIAGRAPVALGDALVDRRACEGGHRDPGGCPHETREDPREHHLAMDANGLAHQAPAGLSSRACVVHESLAGVRDAALPMRDHEAEPAGTQGRRLPAAP